MPREKCWTCKKVKNTVVLRACDDRLCKECFEDNEAKLRVTRVSDNKGPAVDVGSAGIVTDYATLPVGLECKVKATPDGMLSCDICDGHFHYKSVHMEESTYLILRDIIDTTGWVCSNCRFETRLQLQSLRSGLARLAEEVAALKQSVQNLSTCSDRQGLSSTSTSVSYSTSASVVHQQSNKSTLAAVHQEMAAKQRRQRNVVVYGLDPVNGVEDAELFLQLCEDYLECKPHIDPSKCRRLGKRSAGDVRTKPLLVVLDSDHSAQELIKKSHVLRGHDEVKDVYVNRDLTPAEALAAYEQRCRRRAARAQSAAVPRQHSNQNSNNKTKNSQQT